MEEEIRQLDHLALHLKVSNHVSIIHHNKLFQQQFNGHIADMEKQIDRHVQQQMNGYRLTYIAAHFTENAMLMER